jgi:phage shock protein A
MSGDSTADEKPAREPEEATSAALEPPPPIPSPAEAADTGYTPDGVPTFESVREKIETRYGTALGATELAAETPQGRSVEEQYEERQRAAAERLEQIRKSMHRGDGDPQ